jgi:hypothetical protein
LIPSNESPTFLTQILTQKMATKKTKPATIYK